MTGLVSSLMRRVFPPKKVGYAFKLKADYAVAEIYGEKQQAGMEVTVAVRGRDLEQAKASALKATRALAPSQPVQIIGMKDAFFFYF